MAQIIGYKEQQQALKDLDKQIKVLKTINRFLETENDSGSYTLSFGNCSAPLIGVERKTIDELVRSSKLALVSQIRATAETHRIEFDEEEEALML